MRKYIYILCLCLLCVSCGSNTPEVNKGRVDSVMKKSAKRGVAYNLQSVNDAVLLSPYISWDYNWGNGLVEASLIPQWFDSNDVEYCPMCWSASYSVERISEYVATHPSTKYLLAFNEPNLLDQANMTPKQAAALWAPVVALAKKLHLKLVSPALNYGTLPGYNDPVKWLDEFIAQPEVSLDDMCAISLHCYMGNSGGVEGMIKRFEKYGLPIWLTEFCAWENNINSERDQIMYMCETLNFLEQSNLVERYAWFTPRYKSLGTYPYMQMLTSVTSPELTELGDVYCRFSSFDKSVWLTSPLNASAYVSTSDNSIHLMRSTDTDAPGFEKGELMLYSLSDGKVLDYQIYAATETSTMQLRYTSFATSSVAIFIDGDLAGMYQLPQTGSMTAWTAANLAVTIPQGKHTLSLQVVDGAFHLSKIIY